MTSLVNKINGDAGAGDRGNRTDRGKRRHLSAIGGRRVGPRDQHTGSDHIGKCGCRDCYRSNFRRDGRCRQCFHAGGKCGEQRNQQWGAKHQRPACRQRIDHVEKRGITHTFTIGAGTDNVPAGTYYTANAGDHSNTLANLAATISANQTLGVKAQANTSGLALTSSAFEGAPGIQLVSSSIADQTEGSSSTATLGSFASESDTISGSISFSVNGQPSQTVPTTAGETVGGLIDYITQNTGTLGVTAKWVAGTNGFGSVQLTSNTIGSGGLISGATSTITDTTTTAALSYGATSAYNTGVTSDSTYKVYDSTSGQNSTTGLATFIADTKSGSGVAITSYSDGAGQALNGTDLLNQMDARSALAVLNNAITDVAAQDGYIGAEINTLNSISQVMSTQQENVVSAQNALQATDYASATSNMSKYEILSQTGIAALAQANSVQQEVTKLLQ